MRNLTPIFALFILLPILAPAQTTKYRIVVLGSSTAAGTGALDSDNSWVNRTKAYYKSLGVLDTIYNMAAGGTYSSDGVLLLPTAMSRTPDIVFVAYPTNDIIGGVPIHNFINNLRIIYNTITAAGKKCYIATTQPRNDPNEYLLRIGRDSIENAFPDNYLDFYDPLVESATNDDFNPLYTADGTHPNDAGHGLLFQVVLAANIIPTVPLPLTLMDFSASRTDAGITLSWTANSTDNNANFFVQRSTDGASYQDLYHVAAPPDGTTRHYSFTDPNPPATNSFYRLKTVSDGNAITFSKTIPFDAVTAAFAIKEFYVTDGRRAFTARISSPRDQTARLAIFSTSGIAVKQQSFALTAPFTTLDVPLPTLSAGLYILQITTSDGQRIVRSFPVLR